MLLRFKDLYNQKISVDLQKKFDFQNKYEVPKLLKIVLNMGVGESVLDSKAISNAANDMSLISGQKPVVISAKKSIATFKLREGMKIGCKVTLRRDRMYDFLERMVVMAFPRVKEFRGLSFKSFDGRGNISFGIKEHIVFSEIDYDKIDKVKGMDVTIVTSAKTDEHAKELLKGFDIPFFN